MKILLITVLLVEKIEMKIIIVNVYKVFSKMKIEFAKNVILNVLYVQIVVITVMNVQI